ncbi:MAG: YbjQ family protein [Limisphaerales bacterium]
MSATHPLTTTAFDIPNYRTVRSLGVVRGLVVRSRSWVGNFAAGIQTIFGGNITMYTHMCEQARDDAFNQMLAHAAELGANAVVGMRYDANEIGVGITEVLCYGTAVFVEPQDELISHGRT